MPIWRPVAVVFDVIETLFDLEPLRARFAEAGLPGQALDVWFARVLRDGFAHAAAGTFAAFPDLAAFHLEELLGPHGPEAGPRVQRILDGLRDLPPHPDVAPGLERLRRGDVRLATLTNGTVELTSRWLERSGLRPYFAQVLDVAQVMAWKPRAKPYVHAANRLGSDIEHTALVSVHPWDIHGATCGGMMGAWLDRRAAVYPETMNPPQVRGRSLDEVAGRLLDLPVW